MNNINQKIKDNDNRTSVENISEGKQGCVYYESRTGNRRDKPAGGEGVEKFWSNRQILSEQEGRNLGGQRNVEAITLLQRDAGSDVFTQQKRLIEWAKENVCFYGKEYHEALKQLWSKKDDGTLKRLGGTESDVFPSYDKNNVIKITNYSAINHVKPLDFLQDRVTWYNRLFPETAYKLLGIMNYKDDRDNDIFRFVLEQPFIEEGKFPKRREIDEMMVGIGLKKGRLSSQYYIEIGEGRFLKITDVRMKNCIKDKSGKIFCIDPVIRESDEIDNIKK